jgi:hypothetical protein
MWFKLKSKNLITSLISVAKKDGTTNFISLCLEQIIVEFTKNIPSATSINLNL